MSTQEINHSSTEQINAPFRVKSAGVSLFALLMIGMYYFANVLSLLPSDEALPDGAVSLVLTAVLLIIVVESVLQTVLFIGAGKIEDRTAHDDSANLVSGRNAHIVLTVGVMVTFGSMIIGFTPFQMGNVLLLAFLLAEVVRYSTQIVYYQRSGHPLSK